MDSVFKDRLTMEPIRCPETSVKDYHSTLRYNAEERTPHQHRGGSLKSRIIVFFWTNKRDTVLTKHKPNWILTTVSQTLCFGWSYDPTGIGTPPRPAAVHKHHTSFSDLCLHGNVHLSSGIPGCDVMLSVNGHQHVGGTYCVHPLGINKPT
jgi:hypothetical protein